MNLKEVLETIDRVCDLKGDLTNENFYSKVVNPLKKENCYLDSNSGATKGILFFKDLDVVIKIPFIGEESCYEDDVIEFYGADGDWDYCRLEANLYNCAKEKKIEIFFAETKYITTIQDYPIYTQPIVQIFYNSNIHKSFDESNKDYIKIKDSLVKTSRIIADNYGLESEWLFIAFKKYGFYMLKKFLTFLKDYDINDLHSGNIGYKNNLPILLDYSGYNE